ncbi:MAG: ribonuclease domain-containing protein [Bacillota bacterium]|nr:ribonuclease domain-containing protein [Bacillota bacterium]
MNKKFKKIFFKKISLIFLALIFLFVGCSRPDKKAEDLENKAAVANDSIDLEIEIVEDQAYYDLDQVASYVKTFGSLPKNYITKAEAKDLGWSVENSQGLVIGGDEFYNREGLLPKKSSRTYYEADLSSGYKDDRGPERLVFSNDGLIFYTKDHYKSFEQLYK